MRTRNFLCMHRLGKLSFQKKERKQSARQGSDRKGSPCHPSHSKAGRRHQRGVERHVQRETDLFFFSCLPFLFGLTLSLVAIFTRFPVRQSEVHAINLNACRGTEREWKRLFLLFCYGVPAFLPACLCVRFPVWLPIQASSRGFSLENSRIQSRQTDRQTDRHN